MTSPSSARSGMIADRSSPTVCELSLAGFAVSISCSHPELWHKLEPWLDLFVADGIDAGPPTDRRMTFDFSLVPDDSIPPPPPDAARIVEYLYLSGWREAGRPVFRGSDGSVLDADPGAGRAVCQVPQSVAAGPPWVLRDLFNAAFTTFLRAHGTHPLHAAAIARDDAGILIVGAPMSGKTWLALNFMRRGWSWVADDKVLLSIGPDDPGGTRRPQDAAEGRRARNEPVAAGRAETAQRNILAAGLFRHFNIAPGVALHFPELADVSNHAPLYPHSEKRGMNLESIYGDARRLVCVPELILFPQVVDLGPTRVEPVDSRAAFLELLQQAPLVNDPPAARSALDRLSRLSAQARAFRVLMGRDLLEDPKRLPDLAREMGIEVGPPCDWSKGRDGNTSGDDSSMPREGRNVPDRNTPADDSSVRRGGSKAPDQNTPGASIPPRGPGKAP